MSNLINNQTNNYKNTIDLKKENMQDLFNSIIQNNPNNKIKQKHIYIDGYLENLKKIILSNIDKNMRKISFQERIIKKSSIEKNLIKGYSLIFNNKQLVKSRDELKNLNSFIIRFKDGKTEIEKK